MKERERERERELIKGFEAAGAKFKIEIEVHCRKLSGKELKLTWVDKWRKNSYNVHGMKRNGEKIKIMNIW